MPKVMIFEEKESNKICEEMSRLGWNIYCTDNIFNFLRYAKELKPDFAILRFSKNFQTTAKILEEIKKALCSQSKCPKIFLNPPKNFEGEVFFEKTRFKGSVRPYTILKKIKAR